MDLLPLKMKIFAAQRRRSPLGGDTNKHTRNEFKTERMMQPQDNCG
jgi:hypothetical protein